jgi:hypothetical protein
VYGPARQDLLAGSYGQYARSVAAPWTLLSNHGIALVCVARNPVIRIRDLADHMGVSDRTAFGVVNDLTEAGYLNRYKEGNRNRYEVNCEMPMRHPTIREHGVGKLLAALVPSAQGESAEPSGRIRP